MHFQKSIDNKVNKPRMHVLNTEIFDEKNSPKELKALRLFPSFPMTKSMEGKSFRSVKYLEDTFPNRSF